MRRVLISALLVAVVVQLTACAIVQTPVGGGLYTDVQYGSDGTTAPKPTKMGEACASSILGLVGTGDATVNAARTRGGINQISSVDHTAWSVLGIYGKYCTVVRGN